MLCPKCNQETDSIRGGFADGKMHWQCKKCVTSYKPLHCLKNCSTFYGHYDTQLGEYIESREHKAKVLKEKGLTQVCGTEGPSGREGIGRIKMTHGQFERNKHNL